jgi:hypothetical protein
MGDCPFLLGEECGEGEGLPTTVVGEEGEDGRLNGDARGELNDNGEGLYAEACSVIQHRGGERGRGSYHVCNCQGRFCCLDARMRRCYLDRSERLAEKLSCLAQQVV